MIFTDINANLTDVVYASVLTEDYDGDGDLDLLLSGYDSSSYILITQLYIYNNDGSGGFSENTSFNLTGFIYSVATEDYDGDGDLDLLLREYYYGGYNSIVKIYDNDGSGGFSEDTSFNLSGFIYSVATEDYDGDGDLDLLLREYDYGSGYDIVKIYDNDGSGGFSEDTSSNLSGFIYSVLTEDYDGDGDLDLLLREYDYGGYNVKIYDNDGSGGFSENISFNLPGISIDSLATEDYDGDGDLDLLLDGRDSSRNSIAKLYDNDGSGGFTEDTSFNLTGISIDSLATEDYDGDGDLDLLITGYDYGSGNDIVKIYDNDGSGGFTEDTSFNPTDISIHSVVTEDYDGDGDLDLLITGWDSSYNLIVKIYRNDTPSAGSNTLEGTAAAETLDGGAESDRLLGLGGNDTLYGGNGHDTLEGGIGDDNLHGWAGDDLLNGGDGADVLLGQDDNDLINGGNDNDFLTGDRGADTLHGEGGNDTIWGWDDNDLITGGVGSDILRGHLGNDRINGNEDNDSLSGDIGNDTLNGGNGNDDLQGWTGDDALEGDLGKDLLVGHAGHDSLTGGEGDDSLYGGDGSDILDGDGGHDALFGNGGSDIFVVKLDSGRDFIADFVDGVDKFGLSNGLTFEDLAIVPSGSDSLIKDTANNQLAIVKGVTASEITVDDFSLV